jgi:hypothetical protein
MGPLTGTTLIGVSLSPRTAGLARGISGKRQTRIELFSLAISLGTATIIKQRVLKV